MKLYYSPGACSLAPHIVLRETGIAFELEWLNFIATEVHKQIGALFNPKMTVEMKAVQLGVIERRLNALETMLGAREYLMGERFSIADAYLFTVLNWTRIHKIDMAKWPKLKAYMARIVDRPKVKEAIKAEERGK